MFVDPIHFSTDARTAQILAIIAGQRGSNHEPERLDSGRYRIGHFSLGHSLPGGSSYDGTGAAWCNWPDLGGCDTVNADGTEGEWSHFSSYGVCDSPQQFSAHPIGQFLAASDRMFTVSFTQIRKCDQPEDGGWRWHKWGAYIGEKLPQYEYIYDEGPEIEEVYCFHIYECLDKEMVKCQPHTS